MVPTRTQQELHSSNQLPSPASSARTPAEPPQHSLKVQVQTNKIYTYFTHTQRCIS